MDIFGIGAMELMVILLLALVVLGPRQLPEVARKLAGLLRDMRSMWTDVSSEFARELDVEDVMADVRSAANSVKTLRRPSSLASLLLGEKAATGTLRPPPSPAQVILGQTSASTAATKPKPAAPEPAAPEPAAVEPAAVEPAAPEPAAAEPAAPQPAAVEPATPESATPESATPQESDDPSDA